MLKLINDLLTLKRAADVSNDNIKHMIFGFN